jgi:hypothetical protein
LKNKINLAQTVLQEDFRAWLVWIHVWR